MGQFERYLPFWVLAAISAGVLFGTVAPQTVQDLSQLEFAGVNVAVAIFIWMIVYPMMVQIDFFSIKNIKQETKGIALTLTVDWLVKPGCMALQGWLFFHGVFVSWVDPQTAVGYVTGMVLLGAAPCTANVFIWSQLTKGNGGYAMMQVSVNDLIMIFAFAPIVSFLLGILDVYVDWGGLVKSVFVYVFLPLCAGVITRLLLHKRMKIHLNHFVAHNKGWVATGLLGTVLLICAAQSERIIANPFSLCLIAVPLVLQAYSVFFIAYCIARFLRLPHSVAAPACLIGTSNFFELAVAAAVMLFGINSVVGLATVVGIFLEVPVMYSLVLVANATRDWFVPAT